MAVITLLPTPYFTDGSTALNAANLNPIITKINDIITELNGGVSPAPTVATPVITISGTYATITCATAGASIKYTTDGSSPSSGSTYSSPIPLSDGMVINAIAIKEGQSSSIATKSYTPSSSGAVDLSGNVVWHEGGAINHTNGNIATSTTVYKYSDALDVSSYQGKTMRYTRIKRANTAAKNFGLAFYDSSDAYISGQSVDYNTSNGYEDQDIVIPSNANTVKFTFYASSPSEIPEGWTDQFSVVVLASDTDLSSNVTWHEGGAINHNTGTLYTGTTVYKYSDALDVSSYQGKTMRYTRIKRANTAAKNFGLAFYDSSDAYISGQSVDYGTSNGYEDQDIVIPSNANTVKFTFYTADSSQVPEGWTDQFSVLILAS